MMKIAKISEMLRSQILLAEELIFSHTFFEELVLQAQMEFEFNSFSPDMFYFQRFFMILVSWVHSACTKRKVHVKEW